MSDKELMTFEHARTAFIHALTGLLSGPPELQAQYSFRRSSRSISDRARSNGWCRKGAFTALRQDTQVHPR
jgi:hypothetical protein